MAKKWRTALFNLPLTHFSRVLWAPRFRVHTHFATNDTALSVAGVRQSASPICNGVTGWHYTTHPLHMTKMNGGELYKEIFSTSLELDNGYSSSAIFSSFFQIVVVFVKSSRFFSFSFIAFILVKLFQDRRYFWKILHICMYIISAAFTVYYS